MQILFTIGSIVFDVITGICAAFFNGEINSSILREGGKHKLSEILAIGFGVFAQYALQYFNLNIGIDLLSVICVYIFLMECVSILENIGAMNHTALPDSIKNVFHKLKEGEK